MFSIGELVRELSAPEEGGVEGRVIATYMAPGTDADQEVYVQPKGTSMVDAQVRFLASDLMLADEKLERLGKYGYELRNS